MSRAYYNEIDPYAAEWLRNLIAAGHIAPGDVDTRSIVDVRPDDLKGYTQAHFFAGIGGWSLAARLAGWPDDRPLWTGSCPCQPFSVAGKGEGQKDERHLWPVFFSLISARRPDVVMGEQVAAAVGKNWLDGVCSDLEGIGYATGAAVVPACAVDAPHRRDRLWFVADANEPRASEEREQRGGQFSGLGSDQASRDLGHAGSAGLQASECEATLGERRREEGRAITQPSRAPVPGAVEYAESIGRGQGRPEPELRSGRSASASASGSFTVAESDSSGGDRRADFAQRSPERRNATGWSGAEWILGADGKARRVEPGVRLLAHGVPSRVAKLRAFGNAIVPQVAAEIIGAYLDAEHLRLTAMSEMTTDSVQGIFA